MMAGCGRVEAPGAPGVGGLAGGRAALVRACVAWLALGTDARPVVLLRSAWRIAFVRVVCLLCSPPPPPPLTDSLARFFIDGTSEFYCMGALVTYRSILTAAHCFSGFEDIALTDDVRIGGTGLLDGFLVNIEKIVVHPDYNPTTFENDVAVVTVKDAPAPSTFRSKGLVLARVGYRGRVKVGTSVMQSGWGATNVNVTQTDPNRPTLAVSKTLLQQKMVINDMSVCNRVVKDDIQIDEVNNPVTHLCGSVNDNVAICSGDSGSPVFTKTLTRSKRAFYYVDGIVSVRWWVGEQGEGGAWGGGVGERVIWRLGRGALGEEVWRWH